jgi:hypothetical protein
MNDTLMRVDKSYYARFCDGCSVKLHCHAFLVSGLLLPHYIAPTTNSYMTNLLCWFFVQVDAKDTIYCKLCAPTNIQTTHISICSHSELLRIKLFVQRHLPLPFDYIHPNSKEEWLQVLSRTNPSKSRANVGLPYHYSIHEISASIQAILSFYNQRGIELPSAFSTATAVLEALRNGNGNDNKLQLNPYALPVIALH